MISDDITLRDLIDEAIDCPFYSALFKPVSESDNGLVFKEKALNAEKFDDFAKRLTHNDKNVQV